VIGPTFNLRFVEEVIRSERQDIDEELDASAVDAIAAAADEILASGLVVEVPEQFEALVFTHALIREVLYASLTSRRHVRLHYRVAQALDQLSRHASVNPAELARHFLEARPLAGPEPARRHAVAAGRQAAERFAYEEAAQHLRRALDLFEDEDEAGRCDVLLALGRVQWRMGDDGARSTFLEAARSAERRGAAVQLARAVIGVSERYFEITYRGSRYQDWLGTALDAMPDEDSQLRAGLLSRLAVNLSFPSENPRGQALAGDAVDMARRLGDPRSIGAALLARHTTLLDVRHIDERLALSEELRSLARGDDELEAEAHHWRMYDLLESGALGAARGEHAELERLADKLGQPLLRSIALGARCLFAELEGDDAAAERWSEESRRLAKLAHAEDALSSWGARMFALRRRQGRLAEMAPLAETVVKSGGRPLGWLAALALIRLETGDEPAARAAYEREMADGPGALPRGMFWLTRMALLCEICAGLSDAEGAEQLYGELLPHASRNVVVTYCSFWGPVDRYLARLAETSGDRRLAKRHADAALERTAAIGAPVIVSARGSV